MQVYSLSVNGAVICAVEVQTPAWMPIKPRIAQNLIYNTARLSLYRRLALPALYLHQHEFSKTRAEAN